MIWDRIDHTAAILWSAVSSIFTKHFSESLCNSHLGFFPRVLLIFRFCSHTTVLMWLQLGRNLGFFYQGDSIFTVNDKQSIAVHILPKQIFTLLFGEGILQLQYMKWSINFGGLPFDAWMEQSSLKHKVVCVCVCVCVRERERERERACYYFHVIHNHYYFCLSITRNTS